MSTLHLVRTPVSYLNQAFTNIVNPHRQFTIIVNLSDETSSYFINVYSKKDQKLVFKANYHLLQLRGHSTILLTFVKLSFVIKILDLSSFEWLFYTGFTVLSFIPDDAKFVSALDDQSKKKAKEELNENEKDRLGAVQSFRSLVLQQDWLKTRTGKTMTTRNCLTSSSDCTVHEYALYSLTMWVRPSMVS